MAVKFIFALTLLLFVNKINGQDDLTSVIQSLFTIGTDKSPLDNIVPTAPSVAEHEIKPSGKPCGLGKHCARAYLCSNGTIEKGGDTTVFNLRSDFNDECEFLEKCCSLENTVTVPIVRKLEIATGCGHRQTDGVGFRVGGTVRNEAQFGEFPWMLAILRGKHDLDPKREIYQCGGSLIHPQVALTAAHCVHGRPPTAFAVRAGEWETNTKTELLLDENRGVKDMVIHPDYNPNNVYNDVALLFLESPFVLAPHINIVCLPPQGFIFDFEKCFATGWGKDQFENGKYQNILKKLELPVVPSYDCQDNLRNTRLGRFFELHNSFLCAGGEKGKDTCEGDGGSPLSCPIVNDDENRYYQAGIVAWGIGCGKENVPGVYVNVAQFRKWIDQELAVNKMAMKADVDVRSTKN